MQVRYRAALRPETESKDTGNTEKPEAKPSKHQGETIKFCPQNVTRHGFSTSIRMPLNRFQTIAFYKPFGVLSQFTTEGGHRSLAEFNLPKNLYSIGRLDHDSEGLLLLTNDNRLKNRLSDPKFHHPKTYWAQVEGIPSMDQLSQLCSGVLLNDGPTRPAIVKNLDAPTIPPRNPPIRVRKTIPDSWIEITLTEGRNRQVRRMTAAVGLPTLRLIRVNHGGLFLFDLEIAEGQWKPVYIGEKRADKQEGSFDL